MKGRRVSSSELPRLRLSNPMMLLTVLTASAASLPAVAGDKPARPRQAVIISFDGAQDVAQWQRSRTLAAVTGARFTYFLSCVYLLSPETRQVYQGPGRKPGRSMVGFAHSRDDVAERLNEIWQARAEGHDIGSHGCGHFDGKDWSTADWASEFASFRTVLRDAWRINGLDGEPPGWRRFAETAIEGFRAPYLSAGQALVPALATAGFRYDASDVSRGPQPPGSSSGVVTFALPMVPEGPGGRRVIAMDYNLFVRHSGGHERSDTDAAFEERTLAAFRAAFERSYRGDRTPLQLGFHFTLMNGGAYWRALERFAREICVKQDVACISYADYVADGPGNDPTAPGVGG